LSRSFGGLFDKLTSFENLLGAFLRARRGKRAKPAVARFEMDLELRLLGLQRELVAGAWRPGPYRSFYVHEQKKRLITAAPFRDRVVHHALLAVLEPVYEPCFIHDSYACREGKGQHAAINRFQHWARGRRFVLRGDVRKFYPSVDHELLLALLSRRIRDRRVLRLCRSILDSGAGILEPEYELAWYPGDDLFSPLARKRGLPIGNLSSQFFGNVYLNGLDHFVKERLCCRRYLRYMDDFAVFDDSKARLAQARRRIGCFLAGLRLEPAAGRTRVWRTSDGVEFLGFRVYPGHRLVRKVTAFRYGRRLSRLRKDQVSKSLTAWFGHTCHGDCFRINRLVLARAGLLAAGT